MATAPSPNDLTRQQLDELDALLQRMLSVPLAPDTPAPVTTPGPRAEAPPLPPSWRVDLPASSAGASSPHIELPEPPPATLKFEPPAPASPPVPPPTPAPAPKPVATTPAPAPKPASKAPAPVPAAKPQAALSPSPQGTASPPVPPAPPVPLPLLPLVALNSLFDSVCGVFGPLGRLLRSGFFKQLYGLVGLGLLLYTAAHIAQKQQWITLPFPLPWPG